jgi:hypothetical protein
MTLALTQVALAQVPDHQFQFVPMDQPRAYKTNGYSKLERFAAKDHTIELEIPSTGKSKGQRFVYATSRETGLPAGEIIIGTDWKENTYFDKFIELNDRFYVIYEVYDRKTGQVDVLAQEYELPGLISKGTPILAGSISFDPKSITYMGALDAQFKQSPDGEHVAFYFDRLRSSENEQLVLIFMMDGDLNPLWKQGYKIAFESDKMGTAGMEVNNNGTVYALMSSRFKNRAITNKAINYSFSLFMMTSEAMESQPLDLPTDLTAFRAMLVLNGNAPRVGGFFMEPQQTVKETAGYFLADFDMDLQQPMQMRTQKFAAPLEYQLMQTDLVQRADGGCYLIGGSWEIQGVLVEERLLVTISMDASGATEWNTSIPRRLKTNAVLADFGYRALLVQERLVLLFPDDEDNLPLYQAGMPPKLTKGTKRMLFSVGFTEDGKPTYRSFLGTEPYTFSLNNFQSKHPVAPNTFAGTSSKILSKKESKFGMLYITFE